MTLSQNVNQQVSTILQAINGTQLDILSFNTPNGCTEVVLKTPDGKIRICIQCLP